MEVEDDDSFLMETSMPWGLDEMDSDNYEEDEGEAEVVAGLLQHPLDTYEDSCQAFSESEAEEATSKRKRLRREEVVVGGMEEPAEAGAEHASVASSSSSSRTVFSQARGQLQLSVLPTFLPCREEERKQLFDLLRSALAHGTTCSLYISGVPGTGKTATVLGIVRQLQEEVSTNALPPFHFIEINGMTLADPQRAYSVLWWHLTGARASAKAARMKLADLFTGAKKNAKRCILMVDELDLLVTRKQDVIYNLFDWATRKSSKLIVVAIANTMDLAQRMLPRVASRMGFQQIMFSSYTRDQLEKIVQTRLVSINAFDADAITWCASKIAAVSGDARRALQICRRAADIAEIAANQGVNPLGRVTADHVRAAIEEIQSAPQIRLIQASTFHEKIFLCALVQELRASASPQTTFGKVLHRHKYIVASVGREFPNCSAVAAICYRLASWGLVEADSGTNDLLARVSLQVPQEDVIFALQNDTLVADLFHINIPFLHV